MTELLLDLAEIPLRARQVMFCAVVILVFYAGLCVEFHDDYSVPRYTNSSLWRGLLTVGVVVGIVVIAVLVLL